MKRVLAGLAVLILCLGYMVRLARATTDNWYVSSLCANNGNGTAGACAGSTNGVGAFNVYSSLNWTTIANEVTATDTVNVNLARGSVFHALLTIGASGATGRPITIQAYGSGAKPIITGASAVTSWSAYGAGLGSTWQAAEATANPTLVSMNGQIYEKGGSATTLNNLEWFWSANVLYFREDAGNPDTLSEDVEASIRTSAITSVNRLHLVFSNLRLIMDNGNGALYSSGGANDWTVSDCEFSQTYQGIDWSGASSGTMAISRTLFDSVQKAEALFMGGTSIAVTVDHSLFRRNRNLITNLNTGTGTLELDNCTILGSGLNAITTYTGGVTTLKNTIIDGAGSLSTSVGGAGDTFAGSGTATYSNSYINPGLFAISKAPGGTVSTANVFAAQPSYVHQSYPAYVTITFDNIDLSAKATDKSRVGAMARTILGDASAGVTLATRYTQTMDAWTGFVTAVAAGDEVSNHGRHHEALTDTHGPTIQYTGLGSAATMTISGTTFSTTCTGAAGDNLSFDLIAASPDRRTTDLFCTAVTANGKYTCTGGTQDCGSAGFADISAQDIMTGTYQILLNSTKMLADEVGGANTDIQTGISGYTVKTFAYPTGVFNAAAETYIQATAGLIGARSWGSNSFSGWLQNLALYAVNGVNNSYQMNAQFILSDANGTVTDSGFKAHNFTNHSTTTTVTGKSQTYSNYRATAFNGTNQWMDWAPTADMDLTHKDWIISAYVTPTTLANYVTVFFNGNDVNNYHWLYLDAAGAAHYRIVTGGSTVASLDTPNATFVNGASYPLVIRSYKGQLQLMHGTGTSYYASIIDQSITSVAPLNYTGTFYYGCAYDYTGSARQYYWAGSMCDLYMASNPAQNIWSQLNQLTEYGGIMGYTGHEDWTYDSWAFFFQIVKDFAGYNMVKVRTFAAALTEIRAASAVTADGLTSRWYPADLGDYRIVGGSSLAGSGTSLGYTTDFAGKTIPAGPYIGAYESSPKSGGSLLLIRNKEK
jgi:hypothetical protein